MSNTALPVLHDTDTSLPPAWEALFEAIEDGICVQSPDGRITRANKAFARLLGLELQDLIGMECTKLFGCHGESHQQAFCARASRQSSDQPSSEEIRGKLPGQRLKARFSPLRNEDGSILGYVMTIRDITDVVARERELARVEQLARLGELAAGLAHEIKNPLAGIQGAMDILISRRNAGNAERQVLEGVKREVERINQTVHLLLDRARPRALHMQPASLNEVMQRAVNLARASTPSAKRAHVQISFQNPDQNIILSLDAAQLEDAVLNLLLNAIDAVGANGQIEAKIVVVDDKEAVIEITDNGAGIPAEDLVKIFSPFFTTQPHGTGLGLPAVRRIARAHGGRVEVQSTLGHGSTFKIHLPFDPRGAENPNLRTSTQQAA